MPAATPAVSGDAVTIYNAKSILPELEILEVFINYDGPKFYSCHDRVGQIYLAYWVDSTLEFTDWLYVRVSATRYEEMKSGRLAPSRVLGEPEDGGALAVRFGPSVYEVTELAAAHIDPEWLPPSDFMLPKIESDLPTARLPALHDARASFRNVLDVAFNQGTRKYEISAPVLGRLLDAIQNTVFALSPEVDSGARKVNDGVKARNELFATGAFASSFGVRLKGGEQLLPESGSEVSLERLLSLFKLCGEPANVSSGLQEYGVLARSRFKHLIKLLDDNRSSIRLEWASPNGRTEHARLSIPEIRATSEYLSAEHDVTKERMEIRGMLVGVNVQANSFALFSDDELYKGLLADHLKQALFRVPSRVSASIEATCDIDPLTDKTKWTYVLVGCDEEV